jgi:methyl-accepting chemotaxis protein
MAAASKDAATAAVLNAELSADWSRGLGGWAAQLRVVAGTTEEEFLAIGGSLQGFYQSGTAISALASEMVDEVAGAQVSDAMVGLGKMLDQMGDYTDNAQQEIGRSSETLRGIQDHLGQLAGPLAGFKKVNKILRMLSISTKIESARLGPSAAGFDSLARDVGNLAVQVDEKAGVILARKDELTRAIEQTLAGAIDSGAQQHDQVIAILDKTRGSLAALTAINERCSSAAAGISAVSEEVSRNVGEVVMSMQAHDMVRQQIEHVDQTLSELQGRLAAGFADAAEVASVCELQSAQLHHAAAELDAAVQVIIGNLREVALKQSGLSKETGSMAGIADQAGEGFFSGMQKDIAVVSCALLQSSQSNLTLGAAMGAVSNTVGEIAGFVGDIETIGEEIKLIALNAQIKSAYAGEEGAALGVLAEAIQRLSIEAIDHTSQVSGTLQAIIGITEHLVEGGCQESAALEAEVAGMVAGLDAFLELLRRVNETLLHSLSGMDGAVTELSREIDQAISGITVHLTVSRVLEDAVQGLKAITAKARQLAPALAGDSNFDELSSRYTMQSERKIHASLLEGTALPLQLPTACAGGLGENVELF